MELPDRDPGLEARAGAHLRQHGRPEARLRGAAHRPARRRVLRRGGAAAGVLNVLTGAGSKVGAELVRNPDVRAISFTGSVPVGQRRARRGDGPRLPRAARARRSQPARRHGRRRARPGRRGRLRRRVLVGGPEVHRDASDPRPGRRLRRFRERLLARVAAGKVGDPADPGGRGRAGRERGRDGGDPRRDRARPRRGRHGARRRRARGRRRLPDRADRLRGRSPTTPSSRARRCSAPSPRSTASTTLDEAIERANAVRFGLSAVDLHARPARRAALHARRSAPGSSTSTRRRRARTSTSPSAASRAPAGGRTSRAAPRSSSTRRPSPSTRTRRLPERTLVTGALGCLGAWTVKALLDEGEEPVGYDLGGDDARLAARARRGRARPRHARSTATSPTRDALGRALDEHGITRVVHLAALQVPFCRADPAARRARERARHGRRASRR